MPGGIIDQKKISFLINISGKKWLFFPKIAIFTTKWPAHLTQFGPKLPTGVNKNCVKKICSWHANFSMWPQWGRTKFESKKIYH